MGFPQSAIANQQSGLLDSSRAKSRDSCIFAFNAIIDHVKESDDSTVEAVERQLPSLASQMSESFAWGVEKEVVIDVRACEWLLSNIKSDSSLVGGQAGNAAEQASALGVDCYLHTNFGNGELLKLFSHKEKIMLAGEGGFVPAASFSSSAKSAHHFVFQHTESRTRFIASYDPVQMHPEDSFCRHIDAKLPSIGKAFVGGLHLAKTPDRLRKFLSEMKRWKEINPALRIFFEMGDFQSRDVLKTAEAELFPFVDMVGLTETELSSLGTELDALPSAGNSFLFHSPNEQLVLPHDRLNGAALEFAKRCASFLAENGRHATQQELAGYEPKFSERPKRTVGLGDAFSCAYFMAAD